MKLVLCGVAARELGFGRDCLGERFELDLDVATALAIGSGVERLDVLWWICASPLQLDDVGHLAGLLVRVGKRLVSARSLPEIVGRRLGSADLLQPQVAEVRRRFPFLPECGFGAAGSLD